MKKLNVLYVAILSVICAPTYASLAGKKIGVDPGHGGCDPGAVNSTYSVRESDANLSTALSLKKYLEADSANVAITRTTDTRFDSIPCPTSDLTKRANFFNSEQVNYTISVHHNASSSSSPNYTVVEVQDYGNGSTDCDATSGKLAYAVVNRLKQSTGLSTGSGCSGKPGVHAQNLAILRETGMPAILTEVSFVSNNTEAQKLQKTDYLNSNGWAIYAGLADFLGQTPISIAGNSGVSRAKSLKLLLDKFGISSANAGFNSYRFGESITIPSDVNSSTSYYDYIVTGYNKGIVSGNSGSFSPDRAVNLAEFLTMIVRAIPIPLNNPSYAEYPYGQGDWYYSYAKAAYNAGIIGNSNYDFFGALDEASMNALLNSAYEYFMGSKSGISIYAKWTQQYADIDVYLYDPVSGNNTEIQYDSNYTVTNMSALTRTNGIVYYGKPSTSWGGNLDYDSYGGNGQQPWSGLGEERITVDSLMLRRPGKYSIIFCHYDWGKNPASATVEWWGIKAGRNINIGGQNFFTPIEKGKCRYTGTLSTN